MRQARLALSPMRVASNLTLDCLLAQVEFFSAPAAGWHLPWQAVVASISSDGLICLLCLVTKQCLRVLSGAPGLLPPPRQLHWCMPMGFLAASCRPGRPPLPPNCVSWAAWLQDASTTDEAAVVVWDMQSGAHTSTSPNPAVKRKTFIQGCLAGAQDRVAHGDMADALLASLDALDFEHSEELLPRAEQLATSLPASVRAAACHAAPEKSSLPAGVLVLEINVLSLLRQSIPGSGIAKSVATALSLLHLWGLDRGVDEQLAAALQGLGLLHLPGHPQSQGWCLAAPKLYQDQDDAL